MNERGRNESDISRYTDVEYSPEGYKTVYRWGDFLEIARGHVYNAMDTIDLVSTGGEYEGFNPRYAYTCEFVGCSTLVDGIALFRPVSRDGEDLTQIAFLRSDIDDDTGAYTECFEAGSFDIAAASDIQCSDLGIDLLDYFRGRSFEGLSSVKRGLDGREAVRAVEVATGCDLDLFEDFWLGSPGETDVHVGPYVKRDLIALSYIVNDFSQMYGTSARDIRKLLARVNNFHPDRLAAVKAYLDCEYVTDRDTSDEKTYRWDDFLEIAGGDARYAAMLIERTAPGEPQEGLHPETLVDQDIRDGEAFMLAGRPIAPEDACDLPKTVHGLYRELVDNVDRSAILFRDWRGFSAGTDADDVLREIDGAFGETEYSRAGTVLGAYADDTFMAPFFAADDERPRRHAPHALGGRERRGVPVAHLRCRRGRGRTLPLVLQARRGAGLRGRRRQARLLENRLRRGLQRGGIQWLRLRARLSRAVHIRVGAPVRYRRAPRRCRTGRCGQALRQAGRGLGHA